MKTKLTTIFKKSANTPPMWACLLFAWLLLPFNVSADPIEFRQSNSTDLLGGASSITKGEVTLSAVGITHMNHGSVYSVGMDDDSYVDVTLNSGYNISAMQVGVYPDCNVNAVLKVQFCSSPEYSDAAKIGDPRTSTSLDYSGYYTPPHTLSTISSVPEDAKSARLYKTGTVSCGFYLVGVSVTIEDADPCSASVTASFSKAASETGEVPAYKEICTNYSTSFTIPGKNTLVYDDKHVFFGWKKDEDIYAEGATYDITSEDRSAGLIEFTAVWSEVNVTDLTITNPENNTIPLSWKIPGICDLSAYVGADFSIMNNFNGTNSSLNYEDDVITAVGESGSCGQYGIALPIPATKDIETITIDCKGNVDLSSKNVKLWGGIMADGGATYWDYDGDLHWFQPTDWTERTFTIDKKFWNEGSYSKSTSIKYVGVFANGPCGGTTTGISFSVKEARYHVENQADIDHIVLMRKLNAIPNDTTDGTKIYSGTKSKFTDSETKTPGTIYYYAVFAVYSDASVSSPVYVSHTIEAATEYTVTYDKGADNVTGDVPTEGNHIVGAQFTVADKGNLARPGHHFAGWNDGTNDYAAGTTYTMPAENVTLTAQWTPFTVPQVTNLAITEPVGQTVPLSWTIPGICDLSNPVLPKYQQVGTTILKEYKPNGDYVSVSGTTPGDNQFGVAFGIPATTNIEWLSFEYRGAVAWNVNLWGGLCDAEDEANAYWQMQDPMTIHPSDAVNWASSGELRPNIGYWNGNPSSLANPLTQSISQVAVYANASGSETSDISYEVRNVRYHIAGQEDIDYIVLVRKENEAPADPTDGTELYSGTKSHFLDNDGTKEFGHTYYYRVFAFHEDGTYSASEPTLQTIEDVATYTVTYEYGADNATGDLPTEGEHIEGASFTVAGGGNLTRPGHHFAGWNDGTSDYAAGTTYTMPAENVTLTAQWDEMIVPNVTGLAISDNELSWNIPGKINLSTWSLSNSTPDYFIEYEKPVADGNVYYDNETEELAVTHSSPAWDQYGVAIPIEITNLESVTYYYKGHNIFLAVVKKTEDVLFWQNNSVSASSEGETITRTPTTIYLNNGLVNPLPTTRAITFCTNPDHKATDETFYIRDVFYHTTGMVDIDHVVLMRKEGSASTGLSDGNLLYSGKLSHYVDNEIKPTGTYYYTVFAVHADGTLSSGETVSAAYENPYKTHTRTGLTAGDYGTICLPYAVAVEDRNGADLFEIDKWDPNGTSLTLSQLTDNENMVAGRPYIFQATAATATFRYYAEGDEAVAGSNNGLVGSYVQALIPLNDDNYIIYNNKLYLVNSEAYVGENRAYIHKQDQVQPAPAYRRRVTLSVNGAQVITDIDLINDPAQMTKYIENGHLFIFREGKLYNAQGQLVK